MSRPAAADPEGPAVPDHDEPAVRIVQRFLTEHGDCTAAISHLGRSGARIVLIAPDGRYGDAVVSSVPVAHEVCRRAGVPVAEWDRALSSRISPSPADWKRMGGSGR